MAELWGFVLSVPGINRLEFQFQVRVCRGVLVEVSFSGPSLMAAAGSITAATEGFGGSSQGCWSACSCPHLNKELFFFSGGRGAVNTFPNKR